MESLEEYLKKYFPELAKDHRLLEEIVAKSTRKSFSRGDIIIDYGAFIQFVPLVIDGLIKIMRENEEGKEVLLYYLTPGNTCAASFSCCMVRKRSEIKAVCEEDTTMLAIPLEAADKWMGQYSSWRNYIFEMYDQRLFGMIDTIDRLAFSKLDEKLWDYLYERSMYATDKTIHHSHHEIATDLNVSREAVSRMLKKLEEQGKIKLERNRISVN
jgi:CRP/FNR family transcriptional regulator